MMLQLSLCQCRFAGVNHSPNPAPGCLQLCPPLAALLPALGRPWQSSTLQYRSPHASLSSLNSESRQHHAWFKKQPWLGLSEARRRWEGCYWVLNWCWLASMKDSESPANASIIATLLSARPAIRWGCDGAVFCAIVSLICWQTQACLSPWASGAVNALKFDLTPSSRLSLRFSSFTFVLLWNQWLLKNGAMGLRTSAAGSQVRCFRTKKWTALLLRSVLMTAVE